MESRIETQIFNNLYQTVLLKGSDVKTKHSLHVQSLGLVLCGEFPQLTANFILFVSDRSSANLEPAHRGR